MLSNASDKTQSTEHLTAPLAEMAHTAHWHKRKGAKTKAASEFNLVKKLSYGVGLALGIGRLVIDAGVARIGGRRSQSHA